MFAINHVKVSRTGSQVFACDFVTCFHPCIKYFEWDTLNSDQSLWCPFMLDKMLKSTERVCVWLSFYFLLCVCGSLSVFQHPPPPPPLPFCLYKYYNGQCTITVWVFSPPPFPPTPHSSFIVVCSYFKENGFGISLCLLYQLEDCIISIFNTVLFYVLITICHVHKFAFCDFISLMFKVKVQGF